MQRGEPFTDVSSGRRKFHNNRKTFGERNACGVRNAFAIAW
jgi:hypothetical protein